MAAIGAIHVWAKEAILPRPTSLSATLRRASLGAGRLAGQTNGVWNETTSGSSAGTNLWNTASNWQNSTIASGTGATADFSQLTLTANETVHLDTPETVGNLIFGDQGNTFNWTLDNNNQAANTLTLAAPSSAVPMVTVNNGTATVAAALAGTQGLTTFRRGNAGAFRRQ